MNGSVSVKQFASDAVPQANTEFFWFNERRQIPRKNEGCFHYLFEAE
jgi:hypothetical protein